MTALQCGGWWDLVLTTEARRTRRNASHFVSYHVQKGRCRFELTAKYNGSWQALFDLLTRIEIPDDFPGERQDTVPQEREGVGSFADETDHPSSRPRGRVSPVETGSEN